MVKQNPKFKKANPALSSTKNKKQNSDNSLKKQNLLLCVILAVVSFLIYSNSLKNGYVLDDFSVIKENNIVSQGTKNISLIWKSSYRFGYLNVNDGLYRPLTLTIFALQWQILPDNPAFAHFFNVVIYLLCIISAFLFFNKLTQDKFKATLFFIFLLFAVHPIHTEVTGNIKSLDEMLCFLFGFWAMSLFYKYHESNNFLNLVFALVLILLGLLSKESAILFVAIIPVTFYFLSNVPIKKILLFTALTLIPVVVFFIIRKSVLGTVAGLEKVSMIDNLLLAAQNQSEKLGTVFIILFMYLKLMIFPNELLFNYSYNQIPVQAITSPLSLLSVLLHVALIYWFVRSFKSNKTIAFGIAFYFISLSLYSNLVFTIGAAMGERFYFFASLAVIWIIVFALSDVLKLEKSDLKKVFQSKANQYFASAVILISIVFSVKTYSRNFDWKSNEILYRTDIEKSRQSARSNYYLGNELVKLAGDTMKDQQKKIAMIDEAIGLLQKSLEIIPDYNDAITQLGVAYYRKGDLTNAEIQYNKSLKNNPNDAVTINNLAAIYFAQNKFDQSIKMYNRAIELNPRFADAYMNIGSCYGMMQKYPESIVAFEKALELDPGKYKAYFFMSKSYEFMGDAANAKKYMEIARQTDPQLK